ncbi:MAG: TonB-dependent receptor, partial [Fidelibacterota bacterium]
MMNTTFTYPLGCKGISFLNRIILTLFICHGTLVAASTVSGRVLDKDSLQPLHGANVLVEELGIGSATDEGGRYTVENIPDGEYTISTSMIGYTVSKALVAMPASEDIDFLLAPAVIPGQAIIITGDRVRKGQAPIPFTDITRKQIEERGTLQDIPMLLEMVPGIYSYSDAGNGIGYTFLKLRGFDQRRVNVSIDGVPLNDPEDHNVYWVDIPNLLANVEDIQVQRGIGTSLYGRNAFGGSVNMVTSNFPGERRFGVEVGAGSYNTRKYSIDFLSGLINNTYSFYGRFSRITTDGYRRDAWSELWSYFLSAVRYGRNTSLKINVYGGPERSHAAWDASPASVLAEDHRHNPYSFYDNETDNFNQPHYELHYQWRIGDNLVLRNSFFYIRGEGYYEQLKDARKLEEYGIEEFKTLDPDLFGADSLEYYSGIDLDGDWENDALESEDGYFTLERTDLVRQKWVLKDQYGWIPTLRSEFDKGRVSVGMEISTFTSDHFGKVLWAKYLPQSANPEDPYYTYTGEKFWVSPFIHVLFQPSSKLALMGELQYQYKTYSFMQREAGNFSGSLRNAYNVSYHFVHPRAGVNYNPMPGVDLFVYLGAASREPSDDDLFDVWDGPDDLGKAPLFAQSDTVRKGGEIAYIEWDEPRTEPESLTDIEVGGGYRNDFLSLNATLYYMFFTNEIVPYGGVDDDRFPITGNAESTIPRGIELEGALQ